MSNSDKSAKVVTTEGDIVNHTEAIPTQNNIAQVLDREVSVPDSTVVDADQANPPLSNSFLSRLYSLPLVKDSLETVTYYADKTSLSKLALEQTKATIDKATTMASPITNKYKPQIEMADQFGCRSLNVLEDKFPMLLQHPSEILTAVKASPQKFYSGAKDKLTNTVSRPIALATDNLEFLVDKYLPAGKEEDNNIVIDESTMTKTKRLLSLANQVKVRVTYQIKTVYPKADMHQLLETNKPLSDATQNITATYNNLFETLKTFKGDFQTKSSQCVNQLTVGLFHRADNAAQFLKQYPLYLGPFQPLVNPLMDFASHEYGIIRAEALKSDLDPLQKATNIAHLTYEYVLPLVQGFREQHLKSHQM